ncbi:MAG TPA: hypothetical protein VLN48_17970 [Bryobacteraceae bacterium]|nr:hypothetical protein [Bryobacteraceae bacterium]
MVPEPAPARPLWKIPAFALTLALCLVMVGNGLRPQRVEAQGTAPVARQVWAQVSYGPVSADGRYAPYADWEAGGVGIHDLLTGTDRIVATGEVGEIISISPDNRQVVYLHFDEKQRGYRLRIVDLRGADQKPRDLTRDQGRASGWATLSGWTPDGKQVLVVKRAEDGIWKIEMISVADGTARVVKSLKWGGAEASMSPDGRFIAYSTPAEGQPNARDIFVLATDGSRESAVVQHAANDYQPVWTPDGSRILFLSDRTGGRSLWTAPVKDGKAAGPLEMVKANFDGNLLGMGRNGILYYEVSGDERQNVYRAELNADGKVTKPPVVATDGFVNANRGGAISPDGQSIVYYSYRPQPTVVVRNLKTGEERAVPTTMPIRSVYFQGPRWFPDGRSVLVVSHGNDRPGDIHYRVDVVTGRAEELRRGVPAPAGNAFFLGIPAPVGNAFFFHERDAQGARLVRRDAETERSAEITSVTKESYITEFSVSPDGKQIAYTVNSLSDPEHQTRYIAIIPAMGGEPREVHHHSKDLGSSSRFNALEWSPDQKYLLFVEEERGGSSAIWRVPAAGGEAEKIGVTMKAEIKMPLIHPDGKSIFFTAVESDNNEVWALENFLPSSALRGGK